MKKKFLSPFLARFSIPQLAAMLLVIMNCRCSVVLFPTPTPIPEVKDIVFQLWGEKNEETGGFGFINADGSGIKIESNDIVLQSPTWSPDKKIIAALFPWGDNAFGNLYLDPGGVSCRKIFFYERMHWASNQEVLRESVEQIDVDTYDRKIVQWDIKSCSISKILYQEITSDNFRDIDLSILKTVVFTRGTEEGDFINVMAEFQKNPTVFAKGFGATWSPDGKRIVFTGEEGLYISDGDGKSIQQAVDLTGYYPVENGAIVWDKWPPMAVWSPDGRFLLYHRIDGKTYDLVKFEIATGKETILYHGGMYPDWR